MVKTKKAVKSLRKTKKISRQRGGVHCENKNAMSFFTWDENSCYLDTFLVGWLHYAGADFIDTVEALESAEGDQNKKNLLNHIKEIIQSLSQFPENPVADPVKKITEIRNKFRNNLQACPTIRQQFGNLTDTHDTIEMFEALTDMLHINDVQIYNRYVPFLGYSPENIQKIKDNNPQRTNFNTLETLEQGTILYKNYPHPEREDSITHTNIIKLGITSPEQVVPGDIIDKELEEEFDTIDIHKYINKRNYFGTEHGILPIGIDRLVGGGGGNYSPLTFEREITMQDGHYELVSIICHVPGHYVGYYKCRDTDEWIFYDDLGVSNKAVLKGGGKCIEDITEIRNKYLNYIDNIFDKYKSQIYTSIPDINWFKKFRHERIDTPKKDKYIYTILYKYLSKNIKLQEVREIIDYAVAGEKEVDQKYLKLLSIQKDNTLSIWFDNFKTELLNHIDDIFTLIYTKCTKDSNTTTGQKQRETTSALKNNRGPNLFRLVGSIDTWENIAIPGYGKTPRERATLLFYHKIE
jgi:rubrerythrin